MFVLLCITFLVTFLALCIDTASQTIGLYIFAVLLWFQVVANGEQDNPGRLGPGLNQTSIQFSVVVTSNQ